MPLHFLKHHLEHNMRVAEQQSAVFELDARDNAELIKLQVKLSKGGKLSPAELKKLSGITYLSISKQDKKSWMFLGAGLIAILICYFSWGLFPDSQGTFHDIFPYQIFS